MYLVACRMLACCVVETERRLPLTQTESTFKYIPIDFTMRSCCIFECVTIKFGVQECFNTKTKKGDPSYTTSLIKYDKVAGTKYQVNLVGEHPGEHF